jgi:hypothetical protein
VVAGTVAVVLGLALTGNRERVALQLGLDVVLGQNGKVGPQDEVVVGIDQVHRRDPAAAATICRGGPSKKVLKSRFISFWIAPSSLSGSQGVNAIAMPQLSEMAYLATTRPIVPKRASAAPSRPQTPVAGARP